METLPLQQEALPSPRDAGPRGFRWLKSKIPAQRNILLSERWKNKIHKQICEPRLSMVNTARGAVFHLTSLLHFLPSPGSDSGLGCFHPPSTTAPRTPSLIASSCTSLFLTIITLYPGQCESLGYKTGMSLPATLHTATGHRIGDVQYKNFHKSPEFHYVMQFVLYVDRGVRLRYT